MIVRRICSKKKYNVKIPPLFIKLGYQEILMTKPRRALFVIK